MSTFITIVAKRLDRINYQARQQETCIKYYLSQLDGLDVSAKQRRKTYRNAIIRHKKIADKLHKKFSEIYDHISDLERREIIGLMESMSVN